MTGLPKEKGWFEASEHPYCIEHGLLARESDVPFFIPSFQRPLVWTVPQKQLFIESIYSGIPIGFYVMNEDICGPYDRWLLDGQQRWSAIYDFVDGLYQVCGERWIDLTNRQRQRLKMTVFPCYRTRFEGEGAEERMLDVFSRLAYGGTPNAQTDLDADVRKFLDRCAHHIPWDVLEMREAALEMLGRAAPATYDQRAREIQLEQASKERS